MIVTRRRPIRRQQIPTWVNFINEDWNTNGKKNVVDRESFSQPAVNVRTYEDYYLVEMAAPGYTKEDFVINVEKDELIISSERTVAEDLNFRMREFNYGSFTRKFRLPEDIDATGIAASYNTGVLSIQIPKAEEVKPRKIDIS